MCGVYLIVSLKSMQVVWFAWICCLMMNFVGHQIDTKSALRYRGRRAPSPSTAYWSGRERFWRQLIRAPTPKIWPAPTNSSARKANASASNSETLTSSTEAPSKFDTWKFHDANLNSGHAGRHGAPLPSWSDPLSLSSTLNCHNRAVIPCDSSAHSIHFGVQGH